MPFTGGTAEKRVARLARPSYQDEPCREAAKTAAASTHRAADQNNMLVFIIALVTALLSTLLIIRSSKVHAHLSNDLDHSGPQKIHAKPVPRIGGVGIVV